MNGYGETGCDVSAVGSDNSTLAPSIGVEFNADVTTNCKNAATPSPYAKAGFRNVTTDDNAIAKSAGRIYQNGKVHLGSVGKSEDCMGMEANHHGYASSHGSDGATLEPNVNYILEAGDYPQEVSRDGEVDAPDKLCVDSFGKSNEDCITYHDKQNNTKIHRCMTGLKDKPGVLCRSNAQIPSGYTKVESVPNANNSIWDDDVYIDIDAENEFVQPFAPRAGTNVYVVKAGMGMGKTTQLNSFIQKHPEASFLVISCRISLSYTQLGVLSNFQHYSSRDWKGRRLIVQYESLHNITKCYDYIVLDEVRSIVSCITSVNTNGVHLRTNALIIRKLIKEAKLTIALDADIEVDRAVQFFLSSVVRNDSVHLIRYIKTKINRSLLITKDEKSFVRKINEALLSGKKICIGCQSKTRALMWNRMFENEYNGKIYTSDTADKEIQELSNINKAFEKSQYVILTSKVTCGCDHTNP